jgi:hypothetical protein
MYGKGVCKHCEMPFDKTGRNHKTCPTCASKKPKIGDVINCAGCKASFTRRGRRHLYCDKCSENRQRKRAYDHQVKTGYIKQPGVGTGGAQDRGKTHHSWQTGIGTYTQHRKEECERCGSKARLCAHHKDRDRTNNSPCNIETLCKRCHQIEHEAGKALPKGEALSRLKQGQAAKALRDSSGRFVKRNK